MAGLCKVSKCQTVYRIIAFDNAEFALRIRACVSCNYFIGTGLVRYFPLKDHTHVTQPVVSSEHSKCHAPLTVWCDDAFARTNASATSKITNHNGQSLHERRIQWSTAGVVYLSCALAATAVSASVQWSLVTDCFVIISPMNWRRCHRRKLGRNTEGMWEHSMVCSFLEQSATGTDRVKR